MTIRLPRLFRRTDPARVAEARAAAEQAAAEAELSARREQRIREQVVTPLRDVAEHNQFAALLRRSLTEDRP